jgi:hypothetical protein
MGCENDGDFPIKYNDKWVYYAELSGAGIYELAPVIIKISLLAIILFLLAMYRLVWQK